MTDDILVSMLIVVKNAQNNIVESIESLVAQNFLRDEYEVIIIDGISTDDTVKIAEEYLKSKDVNYQILSNQKETLAVGWNLGVKAAKGKYVVRPDAHAKLLDGYVKNGIDKLENNNKLAAVGGILITEASSYIGKMIAKVLSNPIGVGASLFRVGVKEDTYSDTAVYAVYKKKIFDEIGFFNESLKRNQDIDFHTRVSQKGYKFLTSPDMKAIYYSRTSFKKFISQAYNNGFWVTYGKSGHLRHMIPMLFLLFIVMSFFFNSLQILYPLYILSVTIAYVIKSREYNPINLISLLALTFSLHISYGFGSLVGLLKRSLKL